MSFVKMADTCARTPFKRALENAGDGGGGDILLERPARIRTRDYAIARNGRGIGQASAGEALAQVGCPIPVLIFLASAQR